MKCSICEKSIGTTSYGWAGGNNAQPINDGRCCDECDCLIVIPARMGLQGSSAVDMGKQILHMRKNPPQLGVEEE